MPGHNRNGPSSNPIRRRSPRIRTLYHSSITVSIVELATAPAPPTPPAPSTPAAVPSIPAAAPPPAAAVSEPPPQPSPGEYLCPICLEGARFRRPMATACGHVFCCQCVIASLWRSPRCPLCNALVNLSSLIHLHM